MRALMLAVILAFPFQASASDDLCGTLRRLVSDAPRDFSGVEFVGDLMTGQARHHIHPGNNQFTASVEVVLADEAQRVRRSPVPGIYRSIRSEVPRCLPEVRGHRHGRGPGQQSTIWRLEGAEVEVLMDHPRRGRGYALSLHVLRPR